MDTTSSLFEESSESSLDPFTSSKNFSELEAGLAPMVIKPRGEKSSVTRSSGSYSIQNPETKARQLAARERRKSRKKKEEQLRPLQKKAEAIPQKPGPSKPQKSVFSSGALVPKPEAADELIPVVSGSYQLVKSEAQIVRIEEVSLAADVSAPRAETLLKEVVQDIIEEKKKAEVETSGDEWFGDKPEGDKYWTVAVDDSQREDTSIWTLLSVFAVLILLVGVLLWVF